MKLNVSVNTMQNISDSLRTEENKRISSCGEYYIFVKVTDTLRCGKEEFNPGRYPMMIKAVFETCPRYFDKKHVERWMHIIPLSVSVYTISRSIYNFDISIYFPSLTTLNILNKKGFIKLLLTDKEVYDALVHLLDAYSVNNALPVLPGNPPTSAFESFLKRQIVDTETRLKLQIDYPIAFEDIEEAQNVEIREQSLRKFGYENYVREGFKKGKINYLIIGDEIFQYHNPGSNFYRIPEGYFNNRDDKIIFLSEDITFLQVKDPSSGKIYFLKVPPDMRSVQEAKAWTFGLEKEEYNPEIET